MSSARPTLPDILRVSQEFAAALDGREQAAFQQMSDAYVRIEQRLLSEADALLRDIMEKGYTASRAQQLERYKALLRQIKEQEEQYAFFTSQVIANEQQAAVTLALQEAETLAAMSLPGPMAGLMTSWNKLPVDAIQAFVGFAGDGSPLMPALQARFGEAVSGAVKEALLQGIALGWHPTKTVRRMGDALNGGLLNNALTWARTETVRASREASRRTYEANPNVVKGVIRKAALDGRTCGACIMLDGTYYPRNPDGTMPELSDHPRGRCRMLPMTVGYAELLGIDLDEGPRVDWQTGPEWVKAMPPAEQRLWLDSHVGKGAGDAYAAGKFDLADIPKLNPSQKWGDSYTVKSMRELGIAKAKVGATVAPAAPVKAAVPFASREEASAWAKESFSDWRKSLSAGDVYDGQRWMGENYRDINAIRRGTENAGWLSEKDAAYYADSLDEMLHRGAIDRDVVLYRGLTVQSTFGGGRLEQLVGQSIIDKGFMATTPVREGAEKFAEMAMNERHETPAIFHITVRKGTHAGYMDSLFPDSRKVMEEEILFPSGRTLHITGVDKSSGGVWQIYAEMMQ